MAGEPRVRVSTYERRPDLFAQALEAEVDRLVREYGAVGAPEPAVLDKINDIVETRRRILATWRRAEARRALQAERNPS